jgi:membrane protease YdiL (CAAX protease family)
MDCPACGAFNSQLSPRCDGCGLQFSVATAAVSAPLEPANSQASTQPRDRPIRDLLIGWLIASSASVGTGFVWGFYSAVNRARTGGAAPSSAASFIMPSRVLFLSLLLDGIASVLVARHFLCVRGQKSFRDGLGLESRPMRLVGLGAFAGTVLAIGAHFLPSTRGTLIHEMLSRPDFRAPLVVWAISAAPIAEEIWYRGFVQHQLARIRGEGFAVVASALWFAAAHSVQLWGSWTTVAYLFLLGVVLAVLRKRTTGLVVPMACHLTYNAIVVGPLLLAR